MSHSRLTEPRLASYGSDDHAPRGRAGAGARVARRLRQEGPAELPPEDDEDDGEDEPGSIDNPDTYGDPMTFPEPGEDEESAE